MYVTLNGREVHGWKKFFLGGWAMLVALWAALVTGVALIGIWALIFLPIWGPIAVLVWIAS